MWIGAQVQPSSGHCHNRLFSLPVFNFIFAHHRTHHILLLNHLRSGYQAVATIHLLHRITNHRTEGSRARLPTSQLKPPLPSHLLHSPSPPLPSSCTLIYHFYFQHSLHAHPPLSLSSPPPSPFLIPATHDSFPAAPHHIPRFDSSDGGTVRAHRAGRRCWVEWKTGGGVWGRRIVGWYRWCRIRPNEAKCGRQDGRLPVGRDSIPPAFVKTLFPEALTVHRMSNLPVACP
ncbi:hypothetical protein M427DRAFT_355077 [Gonapodya prolifera JEL478]|uniref:Uncharacterized protein n=1 Tax=Gonapodya prolifera (strain JEL478) TaxID=1344416 RepID=A0A139AC25_GONPJ|nr:hypothetical protein M427DRAFT_355077 [Gonapodya prolifera JEL478]|eukprot:KXS14144.1 hypothetical protein M427DRAFT_355077 [Gonapodya prolifera JEL478]